MSLKELILSVALGVRDADTQTSLTNLLIRLNSQMDSGERQDFTNTGGLPANRFAENLLNAFDEDIILSRAQVDTVAARPDAAALEVAQRPLVAEAIQSFQGPEVRSYIDIVRRSHELIIDNVNLDVVTFAGFDAAQEANVQHIIQTFRAFFETRWDKITALHILTTSATGIARWCWSSWTGYTGC